MVLQHEVPAIEEVQLRVRHVAQVGGGAGLGEEDVALAPDDQGRGAMVAQELLPGRVERHVLAVVIQQVEVGPVGAGPGQEEEIRIPGVGADLRGIG